MFQMYIPVLQIVIFRTLMVYEILMSAYIEVVEWFC